MKRLYAIAYIAAILATPANAQIAVEQAMGSTIALNTVLEIRDQKVSQPNTAQTLVYDLANANQVLAINMACASGTATLTVSA
jgi:hypothetical protein